MNCWDNLQPSDMHELDLPHLSTLFIVRFILLCLCPWWGFPESDHLVCDSYWIQQYQGWQVKHEKFTWIKLKMMQRILQMVPFITEICLCMCVCPVCHSVFKGQRGMEGKGLWIICPLYLLKQSSLEACPEFHGQHVRILFMKFVCVCVLCECVFTLAKSTNHTEE